MEMLSKKPHLCRSHVRAFLWDVLGFKKKANQPLGKWEAEGAFAGMTQVYRSSLITPFIQLRSQSPGHSGK